MQSTERIDTDMARALLLIDIQKIYTTPGSSLFVEGHEIAIANMNRLAKAFASAGETIIYVRHQHKKDGSDSGRMFDYLGTADQPGFIEGTSEVELDLSLDNVSSALHIVKNRYSCFAATGLAKILEHKDVNTIVVTGFMTNYCCETTARQAHDMDFFVDFIMDATGCPDLSEDVTQEKIKSVVAASLQGGFARVRTTDQFLEDVFQS
jgi:nicotinamidase-related amidase